MLHELSEMVPQESWQRVADVAAVAATAIGFVIWLAGGRFSRTIVTLILVSVGGNLGMYAPRVLGWHIESWATALGGALILGASGFFLHRLWVGVGLGIVLAGWTAVATWFLYGGGHWAWPKPPDLSLENLRGITSLDGLLTRFPPQDYLRAVWATVPTDVQRHLPYTCGAAAGSGLLLALLWRRLGMAMLYSTLGASILAAMAVYAREVGAPWADRLPTEPVKELEILLGMVLFGMLVQWRLIPSRRRPSHQPPPPTPPLGAD